VNPDNFEKPASVSGTNTRVTRQNFPALCDFLRGYLNQDVFEEYGSAENAARSFLKDANPSEIDRLCKEWEQFQELTRDESLPQINRLLSRTLGSGWTISSKEQLSLILDILMSGRRNP
jgi:hypothetical protein